MEYVDTSTSEGTFHGFIDNLSVTRCNS